MKRFAACFAMFGFLASLVIGLAGEAPLGDALERAFIWSAVFALVGFMAGWAGRVLVEEVPLGTEVTQGVSPADEQAIQSRAQDFGKAFLDREREKTRAVVERQKKLADNVEPKK